MVGYQYLFLFFYSDLIYYKKKSGRASVFSKTTSILMAATRGRWFTISSSIQLFTVDQSSHIILLSLSLSPSPQTGRQSTVTTVRVDITVKVPLCMSPALCRSEHLTCPFLKICDTQYNLICVFFYIFLIPRDFQTYK